MTGVKLKSTWMLPAPSVPPLALPDIYAVGRTGISRSVNGKVLVCSCSASASDSPPPPGPAMHRALKEWADYVKRLEHPDSAVEVGTTCRSACSCTLYGSSIMDKLHDIDCVGVCTTSELDLISQCQSWEYRVGCSNCMDCDACDESVRSFSADKDAAGKQALANAVYLRWQDMFSNGMKCTSTRLRLPVFSFSVLAAVHEALAHCRSCVSEECGSSPAFGEYLYDGSIIGEPTMFVIVIRDTD
jgi:hypothetical protein